MNINKIYLISKKTLEKLKTIYSYLDITRLYFIPMKIFQKLKWIIFFIFAISLLAAYIVIFKYEVDISNYYSIWSILPPLFMVYLMWKDKYGFINLSIKSIYMISNLAFLSLNFALVIYLASNYLFSTIYPPVSFVESFYLCKSIICIFLSLKITIHIISIIYYYIKEPKVLWDKLFNTALCIIVLIFFYKVIFIIGGALTIIYNDIEFFSIKCEFKFKDASKVESECIIKNKDKSLNHHFNKDYPTVVKAKGKYLYTEDGREIFDACSGAVVASIGYGNQDVLDAMHTKNMSGTHYLASSYWKDIDVLELQKFLVDTTSGK